MNLPKIHDPKTLKHHANLDQSLNLKNLMHHTKLHKNLKPWPLASVGKKGHAIDFVVVVIVFVS
jgi:hypothetical protein